MPYSSPSPATRRLQAQAAEVFNDSTLAPAKRLVRIGHLLREIRKLKTAAINKAKALDQAYLEQTGKSPARRYSAVRRERHIPEADILPVTDQLALARAVLEDNITRSPKSIAQHLQLSEAQVNAIRTEVRIERGIIPAEKLSPAEIRAMAAEMMAKKKQQQQQQISTSNDNESAQSATNEESSTSNMNASPADATENFTVPTAPPLPSAHTKAWLLTREGMSQDHIPNGMVFDIAAATGIGLNIVEDMCRLALDYRVAGIPIPIRFAEAQDERPAGQKSHRLVPADWRPAPLPN